MNPMDEDSEPPPLTRTLRLRDIQEDVEQRIEVTPEELAEIVRILDLVALEGLAFTYRLRRGAGGRIHLAGYLKARVTQTCVVTLEPVESVVDSPVEDEFWPAPLIAELERQVADPNATVPLDWPDVIVDGTIDFGPVVYESLATALDPYPKRPGASFQWSQGPDGVEDGESGPFAALKGLKKS
ncbi:MAG TPA: DUF177 domain-containing protein [Methyloceanibacter sp.]|nr:DUF177 domain-containing protein [Methyloceanibacter sp.]